MISPNRSTNTNTLREKKAYKGTKVKSSATNQINIWNNEEIQLKRQFLHFRADLTSGRLSNEHKELRDTEANFLMMENDVVKLRNKTSFSLKELRLSISRLKAIISGMVKCSPNPMASTLSDLTNTIDQDSNLNNKIVQEI